MNPVKTVNNEINFSTMSADDKAALLYMLLDNLDFQKEFQAKKEKQEQSKKLQKELEIKPFRKVNNNTVTIGEKMAKRNKSSIVGTVKLSENSLKILDAFSLINLGMRIQKGQVQSTVSIMKYSYAEATLPESFPLEFCIYDLYSLLRTYKNINADNIEFYTTHLFICSGDEKVKFEYCDEKQITIPKGVIDDSRFTRLLQATITKETLSQIKRFKKVPLKVIAKNGVAYMSINQFLKPIGESTLTLSEKTYFYLKDLPLDTYEMAMLKNENIDNGYLLKFHNADLNLTFWATTEKEDE